jgi:hypothetical protein
MHAFQDWLYATLSSVKVVAPFMHSRWGWPICESIHFLGLSLLIGTIGMFDLRLLGLAKRIPIAALHRLIPWGISGYVLNVTTGAMFLMTEPNQYIYNPSFHFKMLFMALAGLNVLVFYSGVFRQVRVLTTGETLPLSAKVVGGASLLLWTAVIVCGRLLTFYRPNVCDGEPSGFLSTCVRLTH